MPRKPAAPVAAPQAKILEREPSWKNVDFANYCTEQSGYEMDPMAVRVMLVLHREWQKSDEHQQKLADRAAQVEQAEAERLQAAQEREARRTEREQAAEAKRAAKATAPAPAKATRAAKATKATPATVPAAKATKRTAAVKAPAPRATAQPAPRVTEDPF
jgi:hypothetical protein